ncbi:MAG: peptidylprolyl isomerase [Rhizobiaceae bacterium]|nr:MAG: peptidylprolyl isomerase [Rhizobiaceae bacterium]CAG1007334.1 putative parvulin-type peptidyl-prolyl cis-trans isomerase [Rhizobiaceae bacterium]
MATVYDVSKTTGSTGKGHAHGAEPTFQELDTRIPPKAKPVFTAVSVDGHVIDEADILAEAQHHPAANPGEALAAAARALVVRELLLREARRLGIDAEEGACDGDGRNETPDEAAIRLLVEREVAVPAATDDECRRYHANNPAQFRSDSLYEVRHILFAAQAADKPARAAAKAEAERLLAVLGDHPGEFAALARAFSDCPSRQHGGNLGQIGPGSTVPEFERALDRAANTGLLPAPVESRFGFHVVSLDRRIPGEELPFEVVRARIAAWLEAASWSKAVAQYIAVLAGKAEISGIDIGAAEGPLIQ